MATDVANLASKDAIRAQLGVSPIELTDTDLDNLNVEEELQLDLMQWFPNYFALDADTSTEADIVSQRLALRSYSKVFGAYQALLTAPFKFYQKDGDGNNVSSRFQSAKSLMEFKDNLSIKLSSMKNMALSKSTIHSPVEEVKTQNYLGMAVSSPSKNVITG